MSIWEILWKVLKDAVCCFAGKQKIFDNHYYSFYDFATTTKSFISGGASSTNRLMV